MIKDSFQVYFEGVESIPKVTPIPINRDHYVSMDDLIALSQIESLHNYSSEFIQNLFTFSEGVQVLLKRKSDLSLTGLTMYLFSSPFVSECDLLDLLNDEAFIGYAEDSWMEHLYANPNIHDFSICDLKNLSL